MEIKIEAPWKVRSSLENVINKKLMKLVTFNDRLIRAEVYLKSGDNISPEDKGVEVTLSLPGPNIFAESYAASHEKAVADCAEKLRRQIIKQKEKQGSRA
jgi:ribosomal subunit interface protein